MAISEGKQWVVKSNSYIEAKFPHYKPSLTQNRLLLWLAAQVHSRKDTDFSEVEMAPSEVKDIMGKKFSTRELIEELVILRSATAVMKEGRVWKVFGIIDVAEYDEGNRIVKLKLHENMKPYLLDLREGHKQGFTCYELDSVQKMRSVHSQRIYELLYQYRNLGRGDSRTINLITLKEYLGLYKVGKGNKVEEKLPRWSDFDVRVLQQAEKDLCNAGMFITYHTVKTGRRVTGVRFTFSIHKDGVGEVLKEFSSLMLMPIDDFDKIRIANTNAPEDIEKAIIESNESGSEEPLIALLPKTKKEYMSRLRQMLDNSIKDGEQHQNELELELE